MLAQGTYSSEELASANAEVGAIFLKADRDRTAGVWFSNATVLEPENPRWAHILATLLAAGGELEQAKERFEWVLAQSPNSIPTLLQMGRTQMLLDRPSAAGKAFREALDLDTSIAFAHLGMGEVAFAETSWAEAALHLEEALRLQPDALSLHHLLATAYQRLGESAIAESHRQQIGPGDVEYIDPIIMAVMSPDPELSILAQAAREKRRAELEPAISELEGTVEEGVDAGERYRTLAANKLTAGNLEGALEDIEKDTDRDRFMTAAEALDYGLIDEVIEHVPTE